MSFTDKTIGFIGTGNMGSALCRAACSSVGGSKVAVTNRTPKKARSLAEALGCEATDSNAELVLRCKFVVLCVKPQNIYEVTAEIAPYLRAGQTLVSVAAGVSTASLAALIPTGIPVVRALPNTPCSIGRGMTLICSDDDAAAAEVVRLLEASGEFIRIPESAMDAACAASSCSVAWAYMFIDGIARGGAALGLDYGDALRMAASAVEGAAAMVQSAGESPETLRQRVCSKGGSTIEGVRVLQAAGMEESLISAMAAAARRNAELGRK